MKNKDLKYMYDARNKQANSGKKSCPYCKSRSWWQTASGKQCNECWKLF